MTKYIDVTNTYIDASVEIGENTIIYPNVMIKGKSKIGDNCIIYMGCYIEDSTIGDNNTIYNSHISKSNIGNNNEIGPYANIRENNNIRNNIKIGSFVELKNCDIEEYTRIPHISYLGDTTVGKRVNVGCGTTTANFDGENKQKTIIKDDVFVGCNTTIIAPVILEKNSVVAAGSTITEDVNENSLAIARSRQITKEDYYD
jgi:bifunctional UDP-N-acetylglucosamine pyrophosphorylase/glucosamine-1-phosphate N-acetyltransferase